MKCYGKSFGIYFYLKKDKHRENDLPLIYMRITVNGEVKEISTKLRCEASKWNVVAGRVEGRTEFAKSQNAFLEVLQRKVYEKRKFLLEHDHVVTAENIKLLVQGGEIKKDQHMLMVIFQQHNDQMTALVGSEYAPGTIERYTTSFKHTLSFLQWKFKCTDIDITKLDYEFISDYEFWLKSTRKCDHNTTMKYLANFRKIVNRCIRNGWLQRDPFMNFKMTKRIIERVPLTELELQAIAEKHFSIPRLAIVRDIFLFSCYTGLAYADVKKLRRSEIIIGIDGEKWIMSNRQKTETSMRIPLLAPAVEIINRYADYPTISNDPTVLPVLSNQKMNAYLKEIADLCGIQKRLTYHIARHTFATTVTLSNGVPIETVSKMLGHLNLKTTQMYAKVLDKKTSDDMAMLREKMKLMSGGGKAAIA